MPEYNIKTIIFDLGGVYFTRGTHLAVERIVDIYKIKQHHLLREFFRDRYQKEGYLLRLGLMTMDEFEERLVSNFNIEIDNLHHIRKLWFGSYIPLYNMETLVDVLRKKYRLVVFSGNIRERIEFLDNRYQFLNKFDAFLFSYDYQKNKRQIEFFEELLNHIQCEPSEAILIDDERRNIKSAQSVGLNAILYFYTEQLINDLKKYRMEINL